MAETHEHVVMDRRVIAAHDLGDLGAPAAGRDRQGENVAGALRQGADHLVDCDRSWIADQLVDE